MPQQIRLVQGAAGEGVIHHEGNQAVEGLGRGCCRLGLCSGELGIAYYRVLVVGLTDV